MNKYISGMRCFKYVLDDVLCVVITIVPLHHSVNCINVPRNEHGLYLSENSGIVTLINLIQVFVLETFSTNTDI